MVVGLLLGCFFVFFCCCFLGGVGLGLAEVS